MLVFGIETSCDETACAIVKEGREILANCIASQDDLHNLYGGVVPELACRRHVELIVPMMEQAFKTAGVSPKEIDLVAVTSTPGLVGALLIGVNAAKAMALALDLPLVGVNHIEAHLYAAIMSQPEEIRFPALGAVFSGGHTSLILIHGHGRYEPISCTVDDAVGETFDKAAKMMGLPYPGGPRIEELACSGNPKAFPFKGGKVKGKPLHFSFSGLKTAVLYALRDAGPARAGDIAASFQHAAFEDLLAKTLMAAEERHCKQIIFGGGVTSSRTLRTLFEKQKPQGVELFWPGKDLALDNAAMIAGLGYHQYLLKGGDPLSLEAAPTAGF